MRRLNQLSNFSPYSTGSVEYSTELALSRNMPHLIDLDVAFYMHLIRQFDLVHVKCDVSTGPN